MQEEGVAFLGFPGLHCSFLFLVKSDGLGALRTSNKLAALDEFVELLISPSLTLLNPAWDVG